MRSLLLLKLSVLLCFFLNQSHDFRTFSTIHLWKYDIKEVEHTRHWHEDYLLNSVLFLKKYRAMMKYISTVKIENKIVFWKIFVEEFHHCFIFPEFRLFLCCHPNNHLHFHVFNCVFNLKINDCLWKLSFRINMKVMQPWIRKISQSCNWRRIVFMQ